MQSLHKFQVRYLLNKSDVPALRKRLYDLGVGDFRELKDRLGPYGQSRAAVATIESAFDADYVLNKYGSMLKKDSSAPDIYKFSILGRAPYGHVGMDALCSSFVAAAEVSERMEKMGFENIRLTPDEPTRDISATYQLEEPYSKFGEDDGVKRFIGSLGDWGKEITSVSVVHLDRL